VIAKATQLLRRDHQRVDRLFDRFEQSNKPDAKQRICARVARELEIHSKLEEEIFYPAVEKHLGEEDLLQESSEEHQQAKEIIAELDHMSAADEQFEEKFAQLVEAIKHHVAEEEGEMLPKVEESDMDLWQIGEQMAERKEELLDEMQPGSESMAKAESRSAGKPKWGPVRRPSGRAA
jgi:hemerythrin superfamily protein